MELESKLTAKQIADIIKEHLEARGYKILGDVVFNVGQAHDYYDRPTGYALKGATVKVSDEKLQSR